MSTNQITNYAGKGVAIGRQNREKILRWVFQWGWSTETVLQQLLGVKRRPCSDLVKRGILRQVKAPPGHKNAYVIGSGFVDEARQLLEDSYGISLDYPWPRSAIPFAKYGAHSEAAQLVALGELRREVGVIFSERSFRGEFPAQRTGAIPDFVKVERGKKRIWHEIELSGKYHERLFFQLRQRHEALLAGKFTQLVFWCGRRSVARNLEGALSRPRIPNVVRRGDGRIVRDLSEEGWNPAKLKAVTRIILLDRAKDEMDDADLLDGL